MILAKFILIVVFSDHSVVAPFHTPQACEAALKEIVSNMTARTAYSAKCHWTGL